MSSKHSFTFLDFELEIERGRGRQYTVKVLRSPAGEARSTFRLPFNDLKLENYLLTLQNALLRSGGQRRRMALPEEQKVIEFGDALFNALFDGEIRSSYDVSLREAARQGKGLRLKLRVQAPELASLPWEYLFDARQSDFVSLSRTTPIVRYVELPQPVEPLAVDPPLRILGMVASPADLEPLDIANEKHRIEQATEELRQRGIVELTWLEGQGWRDLQKAMRHGLWHVFHFIGHGGFDDQLHEGLIALTGERGEAYRLRASSLARLLADCASLRMVVLNSCDGARASNRDIFSSTASIVVQRGIPAVVAMQYEITDSAAIEFSRSFYEGLADSLPVDAAVAEARKSISLAVANSMEWGTPVLFMRASNGKVFDVLEPVGQNKRDPAARDLMTAPPRVLDATTGDTGSQAARVADEPKAETEPSKMPDPLAGLKDAESKRHEIERQNQRVLSEVAQLDAKGLTTPEAGGHEDVAEASPINPRTASNVKAISTLLGHKKQVNVVVFSPDGQLLASGGRGQFLTGDNAIRLWKVNNRELLRTLTGHSNSVTNLEFSPDGRLLVSVAGMKPYFWRVHDGTLLKVSSYGRSSFAFSPDGQLLAAELDSTSIGLWQVSDGQLRWRKSSRPHGLAFSPDGQLLASGADDHTVCLWGLER